MEERQNSLGSTPTIFNPTFYDPFEIKHRRRTSRKQFKVLEKAFSDNPKPSGRIRQKLAYHLAMTPRGVQVWFQNRRAKAKQ
ncbi:homeobox domain-containing protein, partial [Pilobolus umbonatus]